MLGCWLLGVGNGKEKSSPHSRSSVLWYRLVWVWVNESKHLNWQVLTSSFLLKHSQTSMPHAQTKPLPCEHLRYNSLWNSDVQNHFLQVPWCTAVWGTLMRDLRESGVRFFGKARTLFSLNKMIIKGVFVPILVFGDSPFPLPPWLIKLVKPEYA